VHSVS